MKTAHKSLPLWKLTDVLRNPRKDLDSLSEQLEHQVTQLEAMRPRLHPGVSKTTFLQAFHLEEAISTLSAKLKAYAFLRFAENTTNQTARAFDSQVRERLTTFFNRILFLDLWVQGLDESHANRLVQHSGEIRYYLESLRRLRIHALSEAEERVISFKNSTGRTALETLYGVVTNNFSFQLTINKRTRTLTREELFSYVRSPSSSLREAAYRQLFQVYSNHRDILGDMYKSLVQDWWNEGISMRKYPTPIAVRNRANDIPEEAVEALLTSCRKNASLFQEYFKLKARILKLKSMTRFHLYAPLSASKASYPFESAMSLVMEAYTQFSPTLASLAKRVLKEKHLHAQVHPGKMSGAFCYSVIPGMTPYVLLNYTGHPRDIATLAHELGHAVHGMMAESHSILTFHPSLPLAETASVFGEQLLSEAFLNQNCRPRERQALLVAQLDDLYATIMRQAYFVEFEKSAHHLVQKGATIDDVSQCYWGLLQHQFGRAVTVPKEFRWEWLTIPHIYGSPFYCYAYSFGSLLVLALYQQYKRGGESFVPKYLDLLAAGGSRSPEELLQPLAVDIRSEKFWQGGFDRIQELIVALERGL